MGVGGTCAPGGVEASEQICAATAKLLGFSPAQVLPSSTGVIGWGLPVEAMIAALPQAVAALQGQSILPAAEGIVTTDLYPKIRRAAVGAGSIVGIAKGAGMIEPNMATMLVYLLTDIAVPRAELRPMLARAVDASFNAISVDSDTSTSDTVVALSSGKVPFNDWGTFERGLHQVCRDLAEDVVRNGEGVRHVIRVTVKNAASLGLARALGKAIVNGPLFKCAVAGNDPNVGRLIQAIGKYVGAHAAGTDLSKLSARMGGVEIFARGVFQLDPTKEGALVAHLKGAELYQSAPSKDGVFAAPVDYPPHERAVELEIDIGNGAASAMVLGGDLTHGFLGQRILQARRLEDGKTVPCGQLLDWRGLQGHAPPGGTIRLGQDQGNLMARRQQVGQGRRRKIRRPGKNEFHDRSGGDAGLLRELGLDAGLLELGQVVDEDLALQMIQFVLDADGQQAVGLYLLRLPIQIQVAHGDALGTLDPVINPGHRQAALLTDLLALVGDDLGVDQHEQRILLLGDINDDQLFMHIDLGRSEADPRCLVHGFRHVGCQATNAVVNIRDRLRHFAQTRIGESKNGQECHKKACSKK